MCGKSVAINANKFDELNERQATASEVIAFNGGNPSTEGVTVALSAYRNYIQDKAITEIEAKALSGDFYGAAFVALLGKELLIGIARRDPDVVLLAVNYYKGL